MAPNAPIQCNHASKTHKRKSCVGFVLTAAETEEGIVVFSVCPLVSIEALCELDHDVCENLLIFCN